MCNKFLDDPSSWGLEISYMYVHTYTYINIYFYKYILQLLTMVSAIEQREFHENLSRIFIFIPFLAGTISYNGVTGITYVDS